MNLLLDAFITIRHQLMALLKSQWIWGIFIITITPGFFAHWDYHTKTLHLFWVNLEGYAPGQSRSDTLRLFYYEMSSWAWACIMLIILTKKVFHPLAHSFSISQTLWLRLLPTNASVLAWGRFLFVLLTALGLGALTLLWACSYAYWHKLAVGDLLLPALGLTGYVLFSGSLILHLSANHRAHPAQRMAILFFCFFAPIIIFGASRGLAGLLQGYCPYSLPFIAEQMGNRAWRPFLTTATLGAALLVLYPIKVGFQCIRLQK